MPLFNQSIRRKIVGIALGLIVLMLVTAILSMVMSSQVGVLLDELTDRYIPAYGHLARANIRSLERSVALRRMVMMKMQAPSEEEAYAARLREFEEADRKIDEEGEAARTHINAIIDDKRTPSDNAGLARIASIFWLNWSRMVSRCSRVPRASVICLPSTCLRSFAWSSFMS